jgi:hypothetical protein
MSQYWLRARRRASIPARGTYYCLPPRPVWLWGPQSVRNSCTSSVPEQVGQARRWILTSNQRCSSECVKLYKFYSLHIFNTWCSVKETTSRSSERSNTKNDSELLLPFSSTWTNYQQINTVTWLQVNAKTFWRTWHYMTWIKHAWCQRQHFLW